MGRAERRAQAKGQKREADKRRAMQDVKAFVRMQEQREAEMREFITLVVLFVLHDKFGFGRKRLERFSDCVMELIDSMAKGYLDDKDIVETLVKEVKLDKVAEFIAEKKEAEQQ